MVNSFLYLDEFFEMVIFISFRQRMGGEVGYIQKYNDNRTLNQVNTSAFIYMFPLFFPWVVSFSLILLMCVSVCGSRLSPMNR